MNSSIDSSLAARVMRLELWVSISTHSMFVNSHVFWSISFKGVSTL